MWNKTRIGILDVDAVVEQRTSVGLLHATVVFGSERTKGAREEETRYS